MIMPGIRLHLLAIGLLAGACAMPPTEVASPRDPAVRRPTTSGTKVKATPPGATAPPARPQAPAPSPTPTPTTRPSPTPTPAPTKGMPAPLTLEVIRRAYDIPIRRLTEPESNGGYRFEPIDPAEADRRERMIAQELALYPLASAEDFPVAEIVLGESVANPASRHTGLVGGLASSVAWPEAQMWRDAKIYLADSAPEVLHHELFHAFDSDLTRIDAVRADEMALAWAALNPPGFRYAKGAGLGGAQVLGVDFDRANWAQGLVSAYASTAQAEDRAEVFAAMMTDPARTDEFVAASKAGAGKVALIKKAVRKISGALDEGFWARVRAARDVEGP